MTSTKIRKSHEKFQSKVQNEVRRAEPSNFGETFDCSIKSLIFRMISNLAGSESFVG